MLYIPCIVVMFQKKFISQPCYKLMLYLACVNVIAMFVMGIVGSLLIIIGLTFCTSPIFTYVICCFGTCLWFAETTITILLAFNRCLTVRNPILAKKLFQGFGRHTIDLWLCLPTSTAIWGFFCYQDNIHVAYNWVIAIILVAIYAIFFVNMLINNRVAPMSENTNAIVCKMELRVFVQVFIICLLCVLSSIGYAYNERLLQANPKMVVFVTFGYAIFQGSPAVIYLLLNQTIRHELRKKIKSHQPIARSSTRRSSAQ
ncbi:serpentine type 7TM GPCR chemoreceptor srt domain-containing protein [Ditylenchus destructor]|uniref:Serpentine type 7TM GPCR chemoreceptor srt domain-containing protein n=1 Tax=Ditylenchus destructor TaxID=166010 RepID=A0AAD4MIL5_9BILA|nr:serpentine type 7TM GPCR chemoreceptor srt domain-containing protein [Ditylenchus destructor]